MLTNVIVAFAKAEDGKNIRNILVKRGYDVAAVCTSGSQAVNFADELGSGILICGSRFPDMVSQDVYECIPKGIAMLLIASAGQLSGDIPPDIVYLGLPLKVHELVETLETMVQAQERRRKQLKNRRRDRSEQDEELIRKAKERLYMRHHMTEAEAHRYLQKCSMDSGTNLVETAQMIMSLFDAG